MITGPTNRVSYAGNGVTTVFAVPFKFMQNTDVVLMLVNTATQIEVALVLDTDYTLTGADVDVGGSATLLVAPAVGYKLVIYNDPAIQQVLSLVDGDSFPSSGVNDALDRVTIIARRALDLANRSMRLDDGFTGALSMKLPLLLAVAPGNVIAVNPGGTGLYLAPPGAGGGGGAVTPQDGGDTNFFIPSNASYVRTTTFLTAPRTYTLPPATILGQEVIVKNLRLQAQILTVAGNFGDTIEGLASVTLPPGVSVMFVCASVGIWDAN